MRAQHRLTLIAAACCLAWTTAAPVQARDMTPEQIRAVKADGTDASILPGNDFNRYANGVWMKQAVIEPSKAGTGVFDALAEESDHAVKKIIQKSMLAQAGTAERKPGDFYTAYADVKTINQLGMTPVQPQLAEIAALKDKQALSAYLGKYLRADVDPINATQMHTTHLFGLWVSQGLHKPDQYQPYLLQGGLGLPDREYYVTNSADMKKLRQTYQQYIAGVFRYAGIADADKAAARVLALEMQIARGHAKREESSDMKKVDNSWRVADFARHAPGLDWQAFMQAAGLEKQAEWIIWHPGALKHSAGLVGSVPLESWQDYLRFHAIHHRMMVLPQALFDLYFPLEKALSGVSQPESREKYAIAATNDALGEEIGKLYVAEHFSPQAKQKIREMVDDLLQAFAGRVERLSWMSAATRSEALAKLKNTYVGVGYPDQWRDYSALDVKADDAYGNAVRAERWQYQYALSKFGKPVDRTEWCMNPQLVNAVNMPLQNAVNFPAAFLQAPNFDPEASDAVNYGAIGATIGHEISHSFDNTGAMFDAKGALRNWWTAADLQHFRQAGKALARQFDGYKPFPDLAVKGQQTLGENIADLAGLQAAFDAYRMAMQRKGQTPDAQSDRAFFLSYAKSFRGVIRDETLRKIILTNEHAPEQFRVQTVRNLDAWYDAFDVKPGQSLYLTPAQRVRIW